MYTVEQIKRDGMINALKERIGILFLKSEKKLGKMLEIQTILMNLMKQSTRQKQL